MSMSRKIIGNRVFVPTSKPRSFGGYKRSKALAEIEEYGLARKITLVVGQNKGKQPKNRKGSCKIKPEKFSAAAVDKVFFREREFQVGKGFTAGTRTSGRGWYQGDEESSVAYEISYIPPEGGGSPNEPTFEAFSRNVDRLAERLAETLCQDSVLIVRDDGTKRTVAGAVWKPRRKR